MLSRFNNVITKKIQTFYFDRSNKYDIIKLKEIYKKLSLAKKRRDIIILSPESIKSIYLKYFEMNHKVQELKDVIEIVFMKEKIKVMKDIFKIFSTSILIMDEVDLLLHPLKSELNFPIGKKKN
jgi:transcriptional regulator with AAA-type ATPase domain